MEDRQPMRPSTTVEVLRRVPQIDLGKVDPEKLADESIFKPVNILKSTKMPVIEQSAPQNIGCSRGGRRFGGRASGCHHHQRYSSLGHTPVHQWT